MAKHCSVYSVILSNRLTTEVASRVPEALTAAGLPSASIPDFLTALSSGNATAFNDVPGITPAILQAGTLSYKDASLRAYRVVFFSAIAFSGLGVILTWFLPDIDHKLTNEVSTTLHAKDEQIVNADKEEQREAVYV